MTIPQMFEVVPHGDLARLFMKLGDLHVVLKFVFLTPATSGPPEELHRHAAIAAMRILARRFEEEAVSRATPELPIEHFFRITWDESKPVGRCIPFAEFWGKDDAEKKPFANGWTIPEIDGYKTAFFNPPYGLGGSVDKQREVFQRLTQHILGEHPTDSEIYSWSTDWSNYFDAGHEWWGAFYWTIRPASDALPWVVIAASTTD